MESQPTDPHLLAQRLHAGGLPERDRRAAPPQIPPGYLHTDRRGIFCVRVVFFLLIKWWLGTSLMQSDLHTSPPPQTVVPLTG